MPTRLIGTAYRIDGIELGASDIIAAGTSLTAVTLETIDPDSSDFTVTPRSVIFEGTVNETVLSDAEEITFLADGVEIASRSPAFEYVNLFTNGGPVFGISFFAGGDTYFLPRNDFAGVAFSSVTADSQIRANDVGFDQLEFGLLPPGTTEFEGRVFGSGAIDAPGLGLTRSVIDSDEVAFNPDASTEITDFNAEVLTTVTFADGSSISGVNGFQSGGITFVANQTVDTRAFAVDVAAVEAGGYTLGDIATVRFEAFTDHDLTYTDVGFEAVATAPGGAEPPQEAAGDVFVFGADAGNGQRDRDVIRDFDAAEDLLVLEQGVEILRVVERGGDLRITLDGGDRDRIIIRDADESVLDSLLLVSGDYADALG